MVDKIKNIFAQNEISVSEEQAIQLKIFYDRMIEANRHVNLTAITKEEEVIEKHFIDSISCSKIMDMNRVERIIDIGTGAGFPGIPLKIMYPHIEFILIDSLNKRIKFINRVIEDLKLDKIQAIHIRAEDLARDKRYRASFDLCVSRAVAGLSTLTEYAIPFVRVNGYFIAYKSVKAFEEIKQADHCFNLLGCKVEEVRNFELGVQENKRVLIKIKKCKGTSKIYPRKAGIPAKNPL